MAIIIALKKYIHKSKQYNPKMQPYPPLYTSSPPTKSSQCYKCKSPLTIPMASCLAQCESCGRYNLFTCHVIPKQPNIRENNLKITCPICKSVYTVIQCYKCRNLCGIKNFMSGFSYQCSCQAKAVYIVCRECKKVLVLPYGKNYQKVEINCKNCSKAFKYKICGTCRSCIYKDVQDPTQIYLCANDKCPQSGTGKQNSLSPLSSNPYGYFQSEQVEQGLNYRISQFEQQAKNQDKKYSDVCKVCMDKQAIMINTSCYHLALCQGCAKDIENKSGECPICRMKGKYQKVFKP